MYDYFYGPQADQFNFIRIPAVLFSKEEFKCISPEAKVLNGILLKRMDLSAKNGWFDEQGSSIQQPANLRSIRRPSGPVKAALLSSVLTKEVHDYGDEL